MLAPYLGGIFILSGIEHSESDLSAMGTDQLNQYLQSEADAVKIPYLIIAIVVLAVAALIYFTTMPEVPAEEKKLKSGVGKALKHPQLKWGVVAQFFM